ncbi:hypothetical protein OGV49_00070, partial [Citrobacter sp. Cb021]|uniref:hypothetical protein n=1 Tax=Citrobacter sp. Cb021 TaxID=2985018 RepID=UPI00257BEE3C
GFRSPQWYHFSEAQTPVNVQERLTAASARIPAGRPGQPSTPHRFSAGTGSSLQRTDFQLNLFCCSDKKRRGSGVGWSG